MPTNVGNAQLLARLEPALIDFVDMDEETRVSIGLFRQSHKQLKRWRTKHA